MGRRRRGRTRSAVAGETQPSAVDAAWAREIAADLQAHRGRSLVVAGSRQPPLVHALVQLINVALGNVVEQCEVCRGFR